MFGRSPREIDVITTSEVIVSDRELQYSGTVMHYNKCCDSIIMATLL